MWKSKCHVWIRLYVRHTKYTVCMCVYSNEMCTWCAKSYFKISKLSIHTHTHTREIFDVFHMLTHQCLFYHLYANNNQRQPKIQQHFLSWIERERTNRMKIRLKSVYRIKTNFPNAIIFFRMQNIYYKTRIWYRYGF